MEKYWRTNITPPANPCTRLHGLVIGLSRDRNNRTYLVYSSIFGNLIEISTSVGDLRIGSWLFINVRSENFNGEFTLDNSNSFGYNDGEALPDVKYAHARFFPKTPGNRYEGEVLITARFGIRLNRQQTAFEYVSYDVHHAHFVDEFKLIEQSDEFYHGRSFILEMQASFEGLVVLKVHEDPDRVLRCDKVPDSVVPDNVLSLDETCLLTCLTEEEPCASNNPGPSTAQSLPTEPEPRVEPAPIQVRSTTNSVTTDNVPTVPVPQVELQPERAEERSTDLRPPEREEEREEEAETDEEVLKTRGTSNFPPRPFCADIGQETLARCAQETAFTDGSGPLSALCVVVQKFDKFAIMYTAKHGILDVLVQEDSCTGLDEPLKLGDMAFFEISPRRVDTRDQLLPKLPYTHVAVRRKPPTAKNLETFKNFRKQVRTFGGLLEMFVRIEMNVPGHVQSYFDANDGTSTEGFLFILTATNGQLCTIPKKRLIVHVDVNFEAPFVLEAWAVHRRAVGEVALHIGKAGRAFRHFPDGTVRELPPLSD